jgi:hypothetical protein
MRLALALLLILFAGCSGSTEPKPVLTLGNPVDVERQPSWSPDATAIVYRHGENHIRIIDFVSGAITDVGDGFEPGGVRTDTPSHMPPPTGSAFTTSPRDRTRCCTSNGPLFGASREHRHGRRIRSGWRSTCRRILSAASSSHVMVMHVANGTRMSLGKEPAMQPCWMPGTPPWSWRAELPTGTRTSRSLASTGRSDAG